MKDPYQVLRQKEMEIERVQKEIEALRFAVPLLAEDADRLELGLSPPVSVAQFRGTGVQEWPRREHSPTR